ncbi:hypothetical protein KQ247_17565 [Ruegeria pomeroyi]|nr:hypothetical protein [Ruegeria pomeroyi]NVL00596.1 hypothetical protein [Ruegeria pomeroyi]QWV08595.1 hypothetical protein KQ247_17565 [Ruegeria pomeroyi]
MSRTALFPLLLLMAAACTQVPELNERIGPDLRTAAFPKLVPLDEALGPPVDPEGEARAVQEALEARRAALAGRARRLQQASHDDSTQTSTE